MKPPLIVWSGTFRRLVELINLIYLARSLPLERREVGPLLDGLLKSTRQHFNHENSILIHINRGQMPIDIDKTGFIKTMIAAAVDEHVTNHASSLQQLSSIIRKIRFELASDEPTLSADLKDWFKPIKRRQKACEV